MLLSAPGCLIRRKITCKFLDADSNILQGYASFTAKFDITDIFKFSFYYVVISPILRTWKLNSRPLEGIENNVTDWMTYKAHPAHNKIGYKTCHSQRRFLDKRASSI